ncbi:MAG: hypothetical protein IBJ00_04435 [Alphaproteobacteria bacterium]|nr:hypothetical protein [Alphaproteobacteria bacterium]
MKKILQNIIFFILTSYVIFTHDQAMGSHPDALKENPQSFNQPKEGEQASNEKTTLNLPKENPAKQDEYQDCLMLMKTARFKSEADRQTYEKKCEEKRDNSSGKQ